MNLMTVLPPDYEENSTMTELQDILSGQSNNAEYALKKISDEVFIDSSTDTLSRREDMFGISNKYGNSEAELDVRRKIIKDKLCYRSTATVALIKELAERYVGSTVDIIEENDTYSVKISFINDVDTPFFIDALRNSLKAVMPAHIGITYSYSVGVVIILLEKFVNCRIYIRFTTNFYYFVLRNIRPFDGNWYFDGVYKFNGLYPDAGTSIIGMPVAMAVKGIFSNIREVFSNARTSRISLFVKSAMTAKVNRLICSSYVKNNEKCQDVLIENDIGHVKFDYAFTAAAVTTFKNYWQFDGNYNFDGTRNFNAEVIKEEL